MAIIIPEDWRKDLIASATKYSAARGIKLTTLGGIIVKDGDFFSLLEKGGSCKVDTYIKVRRWFKENPVRSSVGNLQRIGINASQIICK